MNSEEKRGQRRKLGKGLGALLGDIQSEQVVSLRAPSKKKEKPAPKKELATGDALTSLPIAKIEPHPEQPRRHFDEAALADLAASIASRGVIQPIIVRPAGGGRFQLVAGERRWRAAQKAQLHEIPALVRDLSDRDVMALALIENLQREDLNPVEEARAYQRLSQDEGMTQAEIGRLVEKSRSHVANLQRLLSLPEPVLDYVESGQLDMGHARALIGHDNAEEIATRAVSGSLSVREVEKLVRSPQKTKNNGVRKKKPHDSEQNADIAAIQQQLEEFLGLSVRINGDSDPSSGAITVRYRTLDQLDMLCQRLTGGEI